MKQLMLYYCFPLYIYRTPGACVFSQADIFDRQEYCKHDSLKQSMNISLKLWENRRLNCPNRAFHPGGQYWNHYPDVVLFFKGARYKTNFHTVQQLPQKQSSITHFAIVAKDGPFWLGVVTSPQLICGVTKKREACMSEKLSKTWQREIGYILDHIVQQIVSYHQLETRGLTSGQNLLVSQICL